MPMYIHFLGIEAYGLIGVFAALQSVLGILDMGLSATITREMARSSVLPGKPEDSRDLLRSFEAIYWGMAIFIGIIAVLTSSYLAQHWLKTVRLSPETIDHVLCTMGMAAALQWPSALYAGGLNGLQKQVALNAINMAASTARGAGAVLILWLISPTIDFFFKWQVIVNVIHTALLGIFLWQALPQSDKKACLQLSRLTGIWRFAAGMSGISVLATILTQLDKIILSKILTLEMFGYYTIAGVLAMSLYRLIGPVFSAIYPKATELVSLGKADSLKQFYHESCQLMSVLILPASAIIAVFSYEIVLIWTQNKMTAENSHTLVCLLICGTALNGLMNIPYGLQLAHGWTSLTLFANLIAIILIVPMIIFMTINYGALGSASAWLILNAGYVLICIHFMHKRLLPHEKWRWYCQDVGRPLLSSLLISFLGRMLIPDHISQVMAICYLIIVSISTFLTAAITTPKTRVWLFENISRIKLIRCTLS